MRAIFEVWRPCGGGSTTKNKDLSSGWPKYRVYEGSKREFLRICGFRSPACPIDTVTPETFEDAPALANLARVIFELRKARPGTRGRHAEVRNPYSRDRAVHVYIVAAAVRKKIRCAVRGPPPLPRPTDPPIPTKKTAHARAGIDCRPDLGPETAFPTYCYLSLLI